jgi:hypothetical protein
MYSKFLSERSEEIISHIILQDRSVTLSTCPEPPMSTVAAAVTKLNALRTRRNGTPLQQEQRSPASEDSLELAAQQSWQHRILRGVKSFCGLEACSLVTAVIGH